MKTTTNKTTAKITDEQLRSLIEESAQAGARVVAAAAAMVD